MIPTLWWFSVTCLIMSGHSRVRSSSRCCWRLAMFHVKRVVLFKKGTQGLVMVRGFRDRSGMDWGLHKSRYLAKICHWVLWLLPGRRVGEGDGSVWSIWGRLPGLRKNGLPEYAGGERKVPIISARRIRWSAEEDRPVRRLRRPCWGEEKDTAGGSNWGERKGTVSDGEGDWPAEASRDGITPACISAQIREEKAASAIRPNSIGKQLGRGWYVYRFTFNMSLVMG
jgi:hypothetical protein